MKHHIGLKFRTWPGQGFVPDHRLKQEKLCSLFQSTQVPRWWRVKLPSGGQAHRGSGTILGGLICLQQQQVAFWEDQDEGQLLRVKSDSLCGSKQQVWPEASRQDFRTTSWTQSLLTDQIYSPHWSFPFLTFSSRSSQLTETCLYIKIKVKC